MNLRDRYEVEAEALWAELGRQAREAPRLEGLYARDADPRVARLVQSAALAFAVAENRLDDDGQALVRPLVARALPESLRPRPASTIVELSGLGGRPGSAQGGRLTARAGAASLPFQIVWPAMAAPIALESVVLDRLDASRQVLRFVIRAEAGVSLGTHLPPTVRLFLHFEPRSVALDLLHALRHGAPGRATWLDAKGHRVADGEIRDAVRWVRVDTEEAPLVSARADRFASGTLLRDLYAFPESFCFFDFQLRASSLPGAERIERVEVVLPLAHVIDGASHLSSDHLRLFCAPATNQFVGAIDRIPDTPREVSLRVAGRPHAEILEVRSLVAMSPRSAEQRVPLRSWETPTTAHTFESGQTYFTLEQRLGVEERTELRATFGRLDAFPAAPGGIVEGEVLASDGALSAGLGLGDVGGPREGGTNITRVTPSRRALLGQNHAWRLSAYARMPAGRLGQRAHLAELLRLHDPFGAPDEAVRIARPRILHAAQTREHELVDGALAWGDLFTVDVDPAGCTDGALWLAGELLHRALAERSEALRYARLALRKSGAPFAEYGARQGIRLPFPLG
ncbi:MAG TPA: type VI secretion system baseplate subunit TssF [Polyangiaceae bacterium]|jgi:type VI protein secretion system component VasA